MPFVRLVIPLGIGIAVADSFEIPLSYYSFSFCFLFLLLGLIYTFVRNYSVIQYSNVLIILLAFLGGATSLKFIDKFSPEDDIPIFTEYNFEGRITDIKKKSGGYNCTFLIDKYFNQESTYTKNFKVKLNISKCPIELVNGDQLIVGGMLTPIFKNKNPHTFDYKNYLRHKQIYHQMRVGAHAVVSHKPSTNIKLLPTRLNNYAQQVLKNNLSKENAGVAIGMITGSKNDISDELLDTYSRVGVMHLLAVSGLHVGIISEALFLLFGQKKKRNKKKIIVLTIIMAIWFFVLFTGASASTVRAGLMFTMLNIGRVSKKLYNPFNAIAFSAFLLLLFNPHYLFDLGFQLSYLAVSSIIFFYPLIDKLWDSSRAPKLLRKVWQLCVLSISANILILPLTIYYFNQVPLSFPLTNIIAVPAAGGIVIGGLAMILLEVLLPVTNEYYAIFYEFILQLTNGFFRKMELIPYSIIENIHINSAQLFLIYSSLLIAMIMFARNKISYLKYIIASVGIIFMYSISESQRLSQESRITIYDIYSKTTIDYTIGNRTYFYADDSLSESSLNFNIQPNRLANKNEFLIELSEFNDFQNQDILKKNSLLVFANKLFYTPSSREELNKIPEEADYVIINHTYGLKELDVNPKTKIILRNDKYLNKWKPNIPEHQIIRISKHGAFSKRLSDV